MANVIRTDYKTPYFVKLAAGMRLADRVEALAALGMSPASGLYLTMYCSSEMYVVIDDNDYPLCAFGVCPVAGTNLVWMVGTDELDKHRRELLTLSRWYVGQLVKKYGRLENFVDERNHKSIRWLKWLGFTFADKPVLIGGGQPFYHFYKEKGGDA